MPISQPRILLLGGTGEANQLAARLHEVTDLPVVTSLAGRTRSPTLPDGEVRIGGFGGIAGLTDYLHRHDIGLIINATHPYAAQMSENARAAATAADVSLLRLLRPAWRRDPLDIWIEVGSTAAAADICKWHGQRILLSLGGSDLAPFAKNARSHFIIRMIDPPKEKPSLDRYELILGKGPFSWIDERRLMMEHAIDLIVSKNSGGLATYAKIDVARDLAVPVIMIDRPAIAKQPGCPVADNIDQALTWVAAWAKSTPGADRK